MDGVYRLTRALGVCLSPIAGWLRPLCISKGKNISDTIRKEGWVNELKMPKVIRINQKMEIKSFQNFSPVFLYRHF